MKRLLKRNNALYAENRNEALLDPFVWDKKDEASVREQLIDEVCRMYPNRSFYYTLLSHGKGVNHVEMTDDQGNTLLHLCAKKNHPEILQMLLLIPKMNEMIDIVNKDGETALGIALEHVSAESAIILIESGANLFKPNKHGILPGSYAQSWVLKRHPELLNRKKELKNKFEESMNSVSKQMEEQWTSAMNKQ